MPNHAIDPGLAGRSRADFLNGLGALALASSLHGASQFIFVGIAITALLTIPVCVGFERRLARGHALRDMNWSRLAVNVVVAVIMLVSSAAFFAAYALGGATDDQLWAIYACIIALLIGAQILFLIGVRGAEDEGCWDDWSFVVTLLLTIFLAGTSIFSGAVTAALSFAAPDFPVARTRDVVLSKTLLGVPTALWLSIELVNVVARIIRQDTLWVVLIAKSLLQIGAAATVIAHLVTDIVWLIDLAFGIGIFGTLLGMLLGALAYARKRRNRGDERSDSIPLPSRRAGGLHALHSGAHPRSRGD